MNTNWLLLGLPCLAGLLMAVQGSINGQVSKSIGTLESNFLMHLIGLAIIMLLLFVVRTVILASFLKCRGMVIPVV